MCLVFHLACPFIAKNRLKGPVCLQYQMSSQTDSLHRFLFLFFLFFKSVLNNAASLKSKIIFNCVCFLFSMFICTVNIPLLTVCLCKEKKGHEPRGSIVSRLSHWHCGRAERTRL